MGGLERNGSKSAKSTTTGSTKVDCDYVYPRDVGAEPVGKRHTRTRTRRPRKAVRRSRQEPSYTYIRHIDSRRELRRLCVAGIQNLKHAAAAAGVK